MEAIFWGHHICCGQRKEPWSAGTKHPHTHSFPHPCPHTHPPPYHHPMISRNKLKKPTYSSASYFTTPPTSSCVPPSSNLGNHDPDWNNTSSSCRKTNHFAWGTRGFPAFHPVRCVHPKRVLICTYLIFLIYCTCVYIYIYHYKQIQKKTDLETKQIEYWKPLYNLIWWSIYVPWEGEDV